MMQSNGPTPTEELARFSSQIALRKAHVQLLEARRAAGDTPELMSEIAAFIVRGSATGVLLSTEEERVASQSLLDYWANVLERAGLDAPDATLADFDPQFAPEIPDELCPYVGLDAFREKDASAFFGRRQLVAQLVEALAQHRLLAVVGPSGSGKSSLVRAGLVPALKSGALPGSAGWRFFEPIIPGADPLAGLARIAVPPDTPALLIVDQFEEVFTLCDDETNRQAFIDALLKLTEAPVSHHVVLTMRSDFEPFVARVPRLYALFSAGRVQVTPLSAAELRDAIEQPARAIGLKFDSGVVDALLQDILGEPAALPLLQFTLLKLWEQRTRNLVTREAYLRTGGGRLALARSADAFYNNLIPEDQIAARRILLRMVRPGAGLEVTSNRIRRSALYQSGEATDRIDRVLDKLLQARLVRLTPGDTPANDQVEVAHEALVRNWPTLVDWLEEERAALATRRRLEGRAAEWVRLGQGNGGLLDAVELQEAQRWLQSPEAAYLGYDPILPRLIAASQEAVTQAEQAEEAARRRELDQARALAETRARSLRRLWIAAIALVLLLIVTAIATVLAVQQRNLALAAQAETARLAHAIEAQNILDDQPDRALLLVRSTLSGDETETPQAVRSALYRVFEDARIRSQLKHDAPVRSLAWRPDGQQIATVSGGAVRIWDVATGNLVSTFPAQQNHPRNSVAWRPDGRALLVGGADRQVFLLDAATGAELRTLPVQADAINQLAWSLDGRLAAAAGYNGVVQVWDTTNGQTLHVLSSGSEWIRTVAFSSDGTRLLSGGDDKQAHVWDVATGKLLQTLQGHRDSVSAVAFSPDGQSILTASWDGTAIIWDAASGEQRRVLQGHASLVWSASWSPDGRQILTGSFDNTARVWNSATGAVEHVFRGHQARLWAAAWSPNGRSLATGSDDTTVRLWDVETDGVAVRATERGERFVRAVASRDRTRLLTGGEDTVVRIWDLRNGKLLQRFAGHTSGVQSVAWSPDERRIVSGGADSEAIVWDAQSGQQVCTLSGHESSVSGVYWTADGSQILTGSEDGTVRAWDAASCKQSEQANPNIGPIYTFAVSPDERTILIGTKDGVSGVGQLYRWDRAKRAITQIFKGHQRLIWSVAFSPDGKQIVTGGNDGTMRVWDAATGAQLWSPGMRSGAIDAVAWSPDGRTIISGGDDGNTHVWDVATQTETRVLHNRATIVKWLAWSNNGRQALSGSVDGTVRAWLVADDLIGADVTRRICNLHPDDAIRDELPAWRGCANELARLKPELDAYDALRGEPSSSP